MVGGINLPKEFSNIGVSLSIQKVIRIFGDFQYADKKGIEDLRKLLKLRDDEICCDIYCEVELIGGKIEQLLLEDKGSKSKKGKHFLDGIEQLRTTNQNLEKQKIFCDKHFLCNCRIPKENVRSFGVQLLKEYHPNIRILCKKFPKIKPIFIESSHGKKPIFWM